MIRTVILPAPIDDQRLASALVGSSAQPCRQRGMTPADHGEQLLDRIWINRVRAEPPHQHRYDRTEIGLLDRLSEQARGPGRAVIEQVEEPQQPRQTVIGRKRIVGSSSVKIGILRTGSAIFRALAAPLREDAITA